MEEYEIGALGDLITGTQPLSKVKAAQKKLNKSLNKSVTGTPGKQNGKAGPIANAKQYTPQNGNKSPQKRKSTANLNTSTKKSKLVEEEEKDDESEDEDDDEDEGSDDEEEEEDASDEDEGMEEESDDEVDDEEDDEDEEDQDDDDDDEDDDEETPEEQSSKPKKNAESKLKELYVDRTIFVGNIKVGTQKKVVMKHFKKYGAIESVRFRSIAVENPRLGKKLSIQKNKLHTKRSTCNAYVRFAEVASAQKAVQEENGKEFNGLHLRVTMSDVGTVSHDNKRTLFVGNLSFKAEDELLWETFAPCGEIESVRIVRDKKTSVSKGFAYINFKSPDSVQLALEMGEVLIHKRAVRLAASEFTKTEKKVNLSNDCCVFVAGFSAGTPTEMVKNAFQTIGPVTKVRLVRDKVTKKLSGCGFVTFKNTEDAQKALTTTVKINNSPVDVQAPRTTVNKSKSPVDVGKQKTPVNKSKNPQASPRKPQGKFNAAAKNSTGRVDKPWKTNEKRRSGGGSPPKTFQGAQGKAKGGNVKAKANRGQWQKKQMVQKVAPKA